MIRLRIGVMALLFLLLIGLIVLAFWNSPITMGIECERDEGTCVVFRKLATGTQGWQVPLRDVRRAYVQKGKSPRGWLRTTLELSTSQGEAYVADYEFQGNAERDAASINAFLGDSSARRLRISTGNFTLYVLAFAVAGGILAFVVRLLLIAGRGLPTGRPGTSR